MIFDHFNRKMDILDSLLGTSDSLCQKSRYICLLNPWTSQNLLKTLSKPYFLTTLDPFLRVRWTVAHIRPTKWHFSIWCEMTRNGANVSKTLLPALFKVALYKLRYKTTILHFWHPVLDPYFLTSRTKKCWFASTPNRWTSKWGLKPKNGLVKPFKFLLKSVHLPLFDHFACIAKDDYDSMLLEATYDLLVV